MASVSAHTQTLLFPLLYLTHLLPGSYDTHLHTRAHMSLASLLTFSLRNLKLTVHWYSNTRESSNACSCVEMSETRVMGHLKRVEWPRGHIPVEWGAPLSAYTHTTAPAPNISAYVCLHTHTCLSEIQAAYMYMIHMHMHTHLCTCLSEI